MNSLTHAHTNKQTHTHTHTHTLHRGVRRPTEEVLSGPWLPTIRLDQYLDRPPLAYIPSSDQ